MIDVNSVLQDPLSLACFDTARKHALYGYFLADLNRRYSRDTDPVPVPTACVMKYQGSSLIELVANHDFLLTMQPQERVSLIIHEVLHVILGHIFLNPWFPEHDIAGIAHDMVINQLIKGEGMPPIPGWVVPETFPSLKLPPNLSSIEYYQLLLQGKQRWQATGDSGDEQLNKMLEWGDTHELMWQIGDGIGDAEQELMKQGIEQKIADLINRDKSIGNGKNQWLKDAYPHLFNPCPPTVDWKKIMRNFVGSTQSSATVRTRKRPNKRFEDAPGNIVKYRARGVVSIDCSGSISEEEFLKFHNELFHMYKTGVDIDVHIWDSYIVEDYTYKGSPVLKRASAGGTDASHSIKRTNEQRKKYDFLIILTDGYIPPPIASVVPTLWVITDTGNMNFPHAGKKLRMN